MRKIVYYVASSIDGFIAGADGSINGFLMEGEHADDFVSSFSDYDTVIMGRGTYEFGFQYGLKPGEPAYSGLKHIVLSKSLDFVSNENVELVKTNAMAYIRQLKQDPGKDIWLCGGGNIAGQLANEGLIDEVLIKVNPIVIGKGIRLFEGRGKLINLMFTGTKCYGNGVVLLRYNIS